MSTCLDFVIILSLRPVYAVYISVIPHGQSQLKDPDWKPDCGPTKFDPTWGATITGARKQLITFNVNVLGTKEQALKIARKVRGEGSGPDEVRYIII